MPPSPISDLVRPKDLLSLTNAVAGLGAVLAAVQHRFTAVFLLFLVSLVTDFLDGYVARRFSEPTELGKRLDMADLISFVVAPGVFLIAWDGSTLAYVAAAFMVVTGLLRLATQQAGHTGGNDAFYGVPTAFGAVFFPAWYLAGLPSRPAVMFSFLSSALMVSNIRIPRSIEPWTSR